MRLAAGFFACARCCLHVLLDTRGQKKPVPWHDGDDGGRSLQELALPNVALFSGQRYHGALQAHSSVI